MLDDIELKEAINKVKIEQLKVPSSFEDDVSQRNLSHYIHNFGHEAMTEFFNRIDEGEFHFSAWLSIPPIRAAAKEAGFLLVKNKRFGRYAIYLKNSNENRVVFTPEMLDVKDVKHAKSLD